MGFELKFICDRCKKEFFIEIKENEASKEAFSKLYKKYTIPVLNRVGILYIHDNYGHKVFCDDCQKLIEDLVYKKRSDHESELIEFIKNLIDMENE